jgi:hypothetical protein
MTERRIFIPQSNAERCALTAVTASSMDLQQRYSLLLGPELVPGRTALRSNLITLQNGAMRLRSIRWKGAAPVVSAQ